jgi:hypothetical protein
VQPCWLRWRSSFVAVHLQGFLQHRLQRNHQPFTRSFLGIHAWHLFHPADPPVAVLLHKSGVSTHARSLAWIKSFQHNLNAASVTDLDHENDQPHLGPAGGDFPEKLIPIYGDGGNVRYWAGCLGSSREV